MNTNKILIAAIIGGAVAFVLGFLMYGMVLSDFFKKTVVRPLVS